MKVCHENNTNVNIKLFVGIDILTVIDQLASLRSHIGGNFQIDWEK